MIINFPKLGKHCIRETLILGILLNKRSTPFFVYSYLQLTILLLVSVISSQFRGSHWKYSARKCVLRNFSKLTEKHLRQFFFLKKRVFCIKKETLAPYKCFPVNFMKFVGALFLQNISGRLLLSILTNSPRGSRGLLFSQIPHRFGIVMEFSQILKR